MAAKSATAAVGAGRLLTYEDLLATPADGRRYEILGGRLVVAASPILKH